MKKPEEIKKGLECANNCSESGLRCRECPYLGDNCSDLNADAIEYIEWLEKNLQYTVDAAEVLRAESAKFERERDAAVSDLECESECYSCKYRDNRANCDEDVSCYNCRLDCPCTTFKCNWQWRGVCPENTEVQDDE